MSTSEAGAGGLSRRRAALVAGLAGLACMGLELTAVRLLAPFFGDSAYVWTNVIGVILLALALGAFTGGRLAERRAGSPLARLLLLATALVALAPLVAPLLGDWLLPADLPLDAAMPALVRGSLAATALLFALPVFLLGAVTPGLVVACVRGGCPTGRAAGAVGAAGTFGSLVGTFLATHWLVPQFGCRAALWVCAALLLLAALVLARTARMGIAVLLLLPALLLQGGPLRQALPGQELLAERESSLQYLRVVRTPAQGGRLARTELKINEGLDSYHSVRLDGAVLTSDLADAGAPSSYYDYHAVVPLLAGDGARPEGLRVLSVGDAAGTFARVYGGVHPGAVVDGVELDPVTEALGAAWFGGRNAAGSVATGIDGRVFVARAQQRWHAIHVDAYSHQVYIPAHLASREFFAAARERLLPGGAVACNVGGLDARDPVLGAIGRTMATVFGSAAALHVPNSRNFLLVARRDATVDPRALARWTFGSEQLTPRDETVWRAVVAAAAAGSWVTFAPGDAGAVLCDDRPELDQLLHGSYFGLNDAADLVVCAGAESPEAAEAEAYAAFARSDAAGVLAAAGRSRAATAYLRYLCGTARWLQRELRAALAEYDAALLLQPAAGLAADVAAQREALQQQLAPILAAAAAAQRNGWVALLAVAGLLTAWAFAHRRLGAAASPGY